MKIYCSGIGGIGLSAYAALQAAGGHSVSGSDRSLSLLTADLESQGITVTDKQDGSAVPEDTELFVYSEAIAADAPERVQAKKLGIPTKSYFEALGELSKGFVVIAVCGTHGKSSTTAMAAKALTDVGLDPTVVVGTKVPQLDGRNWRKGESNIFLLEACEYKGSFFHLHPTHVLMTNVDWDHVDAYPTDAAYKKAYEDFLVKIPTDGVLISHGTDAVCATIAAQSGKTFIDADIQSPLQLGVPGKHMQDNAALVLSLCTHLGIPEERVRKSLFGFSGTWRRFEQKGAMENGAIVIDDYAHHPKEIEATIASAYQYFKNRRIVCLFQPHMHDRTIALYDDFLQAFTGVSEVWVTDVYEARKEKVAQTVNMEALVEGIGESVGGNCHYVGGILEAEKYCSKNVQQSDVLLVMGAGDVTVVAQNLVS